VPLVEVLGQLVQVREVELGTGVHAVVEAGHVRHVLVRGVATALDAASAGSGCRMPQLGGMLNETQTWLASR
jgi:hypothetical protein